MGRTVFYHIRCMHDLAETAKKRVNGHVKSGKNGGCTPLGIGPVR